MRLKLLDGFEGVTIASCSSCYHIKTNWDSMLKFCTYFRGERKVNSNEEIPDWCPLPAANSQDNIERNDSAAFPQLQDIAQQLEYITTVLKEFAGLNKTPCPNGEHNKQKFQFPNWEEIWPQCKELYSHKRTNDLGRAGFRVGAQHMYELLSKAFEN